MHRLTARLLLLVAVLGTFAPSALSALATPPHACCVRKVHRCHDSIDPDSELAVRDASCCKNDGCHAVTTSRTAHAQPTREGFFLQTVDAGMAQAQPNAPPSIPAVFQSSRAPPAFLI